MMNIRDFINNPTVISKGADGHERAFDIYSRLLDSRIIYLADEVTDDLASSISAQLLYLDSVDPGKDIQMIVNSPGGSCAAGLGIIDTMNYIKSDVATLGMGMCASMGAMILMSGKRGKRACLPNCEVMIHQPLGGTSGQAKQMELDCQHILQTKKKLYEMIKNCTGQDMKTIENDCDRDHWLSAEECVKYGKYGIIDKIVSKAK